MRRARCNAVIDISGLLIQKQAAGSSQVPFISVKSVPCHLAQILSNGTATEFDVVQSHQ